MFWTRYPHRCRTRSSYNLSVTYLLPKKSHQNILRTPCHQRRICLASKTAIHQVGRSLQVLDFCTFPTDFCFWRSTLLLNCFCCCSQGDLWSCTFGARSTFCISSDTTEMRLEQKTNALFRGRTHSTETQYPSDVNCYNHKSMQQTGTFHL